MVAVPAIDAGSSTDSIKMRYGNPTAGPAQDPAAVWSNGYVGVWHFAEDPATAMQLFDSSPNPNVGVVSAVPPISATGQIGAALELDGVDDQVAVMSDASLAVTTATQTGAVFQDGAPDGTSTTPSPATVVDGRLTIGRTTTGIEPFPGSLDEVRISSVARSAAWIDAQHASMTNMFVSYGVAAAPSGCP